MTYRRGDTGNAENVWLRFDVFLQPFIHQAAVTTNWISRIFYGETKMWLPEPHAAKYRRWQFCGLTRSKLPRMAPVDRTTALSINNYWMHVGLPCGSDAIGPSQVWKLFYHTSSRPCVPGSPLICKPPLAGLDLSVLMA